MSDELKPCPCCGSASLETTENINESNNLGRCGAVWCECGLHMSARTLKEAMTAWNARAERTCRFSLEEDREMLAEKAACGPGEFVTQDMPDLLWTCSACGEQYKNGLDALPGWLRHCPSCGAKVTDEEEVG